MQKIEFFYPFLQPQFDKYEKIYFMKKIKDLQRYIFIILQLKVRKNICQPSQKKSLYFYYFRNFFRAKESRAKQTFYNVCLLSNSKVRNVNKKAIGGGTSKTIMKDLNHVNFSVVFD